MNSNKALFYTVLTFICFLAVQNAILFFNIDRITKNGAVAQVPAARAELGFCLNHAPYINNTCNLTLFEDEPYQCLVNATDLDGNSVTFESRILENITLFNITPGGLIDFTPNQSHVGNHSFEITVEDSSGCPNNVKSMQYTLQVINVNDPPVLLMNFPNVTWPQDSSISPFDLDTYFFDPDGDLLNYTWSITNFVIVSVSPANEVTFTPIPTWHGVDYITFIAYDPFGLNATGNDISLIVNKPNEDKPEKPKDGGGGGGSGAPKCMPEWYCKPWGPCLPSGLQDRICADLHNCSTSFLKPNLTQPCNFISTCYDGLKGPDEEDVDCGGVCPPCANCYDRIKNQDEEGVDCGGICRPCLKNESCYDGVKNQDEEGIDCGGACRPCTIIERTLPVTKEKQSSLLFALLLGFALLLLVALVGRKYFYLIPGLFRKKKKAPVELEIKYRETLLEKLAFLEKRIPRESQEKLLIELSSICIEYFKDLFRLSYEFTYEEMVKDLRSKDLDPAVKKRLTAFFGKIMELSYSPNKGTKEEMHRLIREFRQIVLDTSAKEEKPLPATKKEKEILLSQRAVDAILLKISDAEHYIESGQLNKAYELYLQVLKDYRKLPDVAKKHALLFINHLYKDLKEVREKTSERKI